MEVWDKREIDGQVAYVKRPTKEEQARLDHQLYIHKCLKGIIKRSGYNSEEDLTVEDWRGIINLCIEYPDYQWEGSKE